MLFTTPICVIVLSLSFSRGDEDRPFPFSVVGQEKSAAFELAPIPEELIKISKLESVRLQNVQISQGLMLTFDLRRLPRRIFDATVGVNGLTTDRKMDEDTSVWHGNIANIPGSEVFLSLSIYGSRGWVRAGGEHYDLIAEPGRDGDWKQSRSRWISATLTNAQFQSRGDVCSTPRRADLVQPGLPTNNSGDPTEPTPPGGPPGGSGAPPAIGYFPAFFGCKLSVETDYQYYKKFTDLSAAQSYTTALLGAVAARYLEQVSLQINIQYVGFWTVAADPWLTPDSGTGDTAAMLSEFATLWGAGTGSILPTAAAGSDQYHYLSGVGLGGGRAYYSDMCTIPKNANTFAVSTGMTTKLTYPPVQGPLTWDFVVVAHELGHNFNAIHTHEYCPPLDQCAASQFFGPCQSQTICSNQGTIMSYCHTCSGGMSNITLNFHPQSVADMRTYLSTTCISSSPIGGEPHGPLALYPIGAIPNEDARVTKFVDLDTGAGLKDFNCGVNTSNGQSGIQFDLISFTHQNIGVPVFAVADGVVTETIDGVPDFPGTGCGNPGSNRIKITHGLGFSTAYYSLRNGSLNVTKGAVVRAGQQIALAGSSSCQTWPRIRFEARSAGAVIDPNPGPCNNPPIAWASPPGVPSAPKLVHFLISRNVPFDATPPQMPSGSGQFVTTDAKLGYLYFYSYIPANATIRHRIIDPLGVTVANATTPLNNTNPLLNNWAWWNWTFPPTFSKVGIWKLRLDVSAPGLPEMELVTGPFEVNTNLIPNYNRAPQPITIAIAPATPSARDPISCRVTSAMLVNDLDYDIVYYNYRWIVNGAEVRNIISAARSDTIPHHVAFDYQLVTCEVTPQDGKSTGPMVSASISLVPFGNPIVDRAFDSQLDPNKGIVTSGSGVSALSGSAQLSLSNGVPFSPFFMAFSDYVPNFVPVPLSLINPLWSGSFTIDLATSLFGDDPSFVFDPGGRALANIPFPPSPTLAGLRFFVQWGYFSSSANSFLLSHGLDITIQP